MKFPQYFVCKFNNILRYKYSQYLMIDIWSIYQNLMLINLLFGHYFQSKLYQSHYTIKSTFETKISLKKDIIDYHFWIKIQSIFSLNIWLLSIQLNLVHMIKICSIFVLLISFFLQIWSLLFDQNLIIIFWSKLDQFLTV